MDYNGIINLLGIIMELYICYYGLQRNYKLVIKNYNGIIYLLLRITTEL